MDPDTIWTAIFGQESNYGQNNKTSVTGAVGPGQIEPSTFAQYAAPGENINNSADNIAVSKRIVQDYYNRFGGDPERIATAYFSGPGNVAPAGSPLPWKSNAHDPNGKYVSQYVSDISGRLKNMDNVPDYLGQSVKTQAPQEEAPVTDYLKQFSSPDAAIPLPIPRPDIQQMPMQSGTETLPQYVNRLERENQGNTLAEKGIRLGAGVMRGGGDVADTLAQGIGAGGSLGANLLARYGIISPQAAQSVGDWRSGINSGIATDNVGFKNASAGSTLADIGRIGGQIAGSAPFLAPVTAAMPAASGAGMVANLGRSAVQGAAIGAGSNALTSSASDQPLSEQLTQGAEAGAALGPAGKIAGALGSKAAGIVTGAVDPYVAQLAQAAKDKFGINITPMQLSGNNSMLRFAQSVLQRTPLTGFGPAARAQQSDWEGALIKEMGQTGNKVTPDLISKTQTNLSGQYNAINQKLGTIPADQGFLNTLNQVQTDTDFPRVKNVIDNIRSKIDPQTGFINAADHQEIMRTNGPLDRALNSPDPSVVQDAQSIKGALDDVLQRTDPNLYNARKEIDYKYAVMKALDKASADSPSGGLSPNKVFNAFKGYSQGTGARAATQLGQIGKQFITEPPSSGSMERIMTGAVGLGGAAALGGLGYHEFDPETLQSNIAKGGLGLAGLLALRYGASPLLRSNALSGLMVKKALGASGSNKLGNLISGTAIPAAALTYRGP